jgi:hypothetical protein
MTCHCAPAPSITDWFKAELEKKLASLADDQARYRELILQSNVWQQHYRRFYSLHEQPFGGPHPEFGYMTAGDFLILLGMIDAAKMKLERAREHA